MKIIPIRAFKDNYIWAIVDERDLVVVDPGESKPVIDFIEEQILSLKAILLTHKHSDHTCGVEELVERYKPTVYGPSETKNLNSNSLSDGDEIEVLNRGFRVIKTAGHTEEHISYLVEDNLFCGDSLFLAGCGRVFTGDYEEQYRTIQKFKSLDDGVKVYAAHEYSVTNLNFAREVKPCEDVELAMNKVSKLISKDLPSLPSNIGCERKINPFFKAKDIVEFKGFRDIRDNF